VDGVILIVLGLGLLWSARPYTDASQEFRVAQRAALERRGSRVRARLTPTSPAYATWSLRVAYAIGAAVVAAGVIMLVV